MHCGISGHHSIYLIYGRLYKCAQHYTFGHLLRLFVSDSRGNCFYSLAACRNLRKLYTVATQALAGQYCNQLAAFELSRNQEFQTSYLQNSITLNLNAPAIAHDSPPMLALPNREVIYIPLESESGINNGYYTIEGWQPPPSSIMRS